LKSKKLILQQQKRKQNNNIQKHLQTTLTVLQFGPTRLIYNNKLKILQNNIYTHTVSKADRKQLLKSKIFNIFEISGKEIDLNHLI